MVEHGVGEHERLQARAQRRFRRQRRAQRKMAAGGIAGQDQAAAARPEFLLARGDGAGRGQTVILGGGETMFRRATIIYRDKARAAGCAERPTVGVVGLQIADNPAAPMKIDQQRALGGRAAAVQLRGYRPLAEQNVALRFAAQAGRTPGSPVLKAVQGAVNARF